MTGTDLREMRIRKGLTTLQAARLINIAQSTMWKWEEYGISRGRDKDAEVLLGKMAEFPDEPSRVKLVGHHKPRKADTRGRAIITHPPRGREITMLRKAYGYTQTILGDMIGISPQELSHIECGVHEPTEDILESLCDVFGIKYETNKTEGEYVGTGRRFA